MASSARARLSVSAPHWQERHTSSNAYIGLCFWFLGLFLVEGGRGGGGAFEKKL